MAKLVTRRGTADGSSEMSGKPDIWKNDGYWETGDRLALERSAMKGYRRASEEEEKVGERRQSEDRTEGWPRESAGQVWTDQYRTRKTRTGTSWGSQAIWRCKSGKLLNGVAVPFVRLL